MRAALAAGVLLASLGVAGGPAEAAPRASAPVATVRAAPVVTVRAAPTLRVVGFGDSVPSGARCRCRPFVGDAAARIGARQGRPVVTTNYAVGGSTSADLVRRLRDPAVRTTTARTELAIVEAGANDFDPSIVARCRDRIQACYGPQLKRLRANLTSGLRTIYALQRSAKAEIVVLGYWNVFRDGAVGRSLGAGFVVGSDRLTRAVNAAVRDAARASGALYADAYTPFKGSGRDCTNLLAADGDHPNARGHALLRDAVLARLGSRVATL